MKSNLAIVTFAVSIAALVACEEEQATGACITRSAEDGTSWCFEDQTKSYCSPAGYEFTPNATCSSVGYPHFCTQEDMRASGARTVYAISRYLNNAECNPNAGGGGGTGGSSGSSSGGTSSGGAGGSIYLQFAQRNCAGTYDIDSTNPDIGSNADIGIVYGPLDAGSWQTSFTWIPNPNPNGFEAGEPIRFSSTLKAPAQGMKRTYTLTLLSFDGKLNRCLLPDNVVTDSIPFTDTPAQ